MAAPLDSFVAGSYYCFYTVPVATNDGYNSPFYNGAGGVPNAVGVPSWLGASKTGFRLRTSALYEDVEGDLWGGSIVEKIYRGANVILQWDSIAFRPAVVSALWPWNILGSMGTIGRLGSVVGGSIVLTAAPLTPAAGNPAIGQVVINSITAANAIFMGNADLILDSRLRQTPITMQLMPFYDRLVYYNNIQVGANSSLAIAGAAGGTLGVVATVVPTAVVGSNQYTVVNSAAYKWYSIL